MASRMYGLLVNTADKVLPSLITKSAIYNHPAGTIKKFQKTIGIWNWFSGKGNLFENLVKTSDFLYSLWRGQVYVRIK